MQCQHAIHATHISHHVPVESARLRKSPSLPSTSTGELCERLLSSTSPPRRILTILRRRTRCCPLSSGGPPPNARVLPFSELVASMRAVCACSHMEVQHVTCARCNASGPRVFCLQWAELGLVLLRAPPHGQGGQHYRPRP